MTRSDFLVAEKLIESMKDLSDVIDKMDKNQLVLYYTTNDNLDYRELKISNEVRKAFSGILNDEYHRIDAQFIKL